MSVDYFNLFPDEHVTDQGHVTNHRGQYGLVVKYSYREVIDFQTVCFVTDSDAVAVTVSHDDDFVALQNQTLGQVINVFFYAAHVGEEKVGNHASKKREG